MTTPLTLQQHGHKFSNQTPPLYFDHEVVTVPLRPSVLEKVKTLEVDWSRQSLLPQAGGGRVGELVGKTLPFWEAGLQQPESRSWSSPVGQLSIKTSTQDDDKFHAMCKSNGSISVGLGQLSDM